MWEVDMRKLGGEKSPLVIIIVLLILFAGSIYYTFNIRKQLTGLQDKVTSLSEEVKALKMN